MYAKRYGISLQEVLLGTEDIKYYAPDGDTLVIMTKIATWIMWYEHVRDELQLLEKSDNDCPEETRDDPSAFRAWVNSQKVFEKTKNKNKFGR